MKQFNELQAGRQIKIVSTIFISVFLFGCATGSSIITGMKRPAINPSEVKIYLDPPAKFETIGIVEAASEIGFSRQSAQDQAINELKKRAAKVGANGVLLTNTGSQTNGTAGVYSNGIFYGGGSSTKVLVQGREIYIIQE